MWELVPSLLMLNLKSSKTGISSRAGLKANLTTVRMILLARFDIPQESFFFMKILVRKVLPACGNYSGVFLLKTLVKPMT